MTLERPGTPAKRNNQSMETHLRPSSRADFDVLATWLSTDEDAVIWAGPNIPLPFDAGARDAMFQQTLARPRTWGAWTMEKDGRAVGHAQLSFIDAPEHLWLSRVIVSPDTRGRGLGTILLSALIDIAFEEFGATELRLRVFEFRSEAIGLYRKMGFSEIATELQAIPGLQTSWRAKQMRLGAPTT